MAQDKHTGLPQMKTQKDRDVHRIGEPELSPELQNIKLSGDSFWEDFQNYESTEDMLKVWLTSDLKVEDTTDGSINRQFPAEWALDEAHTAPGFRGDTALVLKSSETFSMIGRLLEKPIKIGKNNKLVVQYEVKSQNTFQCGGAFLKLYPPLKREDLINFDETEPKIEVVFGPDKCIPYTNEVHFGLRKKNTKNKESGIRYLNEGPLPHLGRDYLTHLYTLIVDSKAATYDIRIDGKVVSSGSLLEEGKFEPPIQPSMNLIDPNFQKPEDWDDRKQIPDPNVAKPKHWDDRKQIPDKNIKKPIDWNDKIPMYIPESEQPEDWNTEVQGIFETKMIPNPECKGFSGCGEWTAPLIDNPKYQGPWAPLIDNPNYQGKWEAPQIPNPNYYKEKNPGQIENPIGAIVLEFWSGSQDLMFNNIYIGKSVDEAEAIGNKSFIPKRYLEELRPNLELVENKGGSTKDFLLGLLTLIIMIGLTIYFVPKADDDDDVPLEGTRPPRKQTKREKQQKSSRRLTKISSNDLYEESVEEEVINEDQIGEKEYQRLVAMAGAKR